ncbi:hypothetical protein R1sor_022166 [Riccia sorocarpa]|uniref:Uncharacterized protein n=1 Tax=Riccia sorocarpa TaxID=122646 RepID=A0ABD3GMF0_9MARC
MGHKRYLSQTSHMRGDCTTPKPHVTHFTDWYVLEYEMQQGVQQHAQSGLNRRPLLAELSYYDSLLIQNLGDPMHEEDNITKNLLRHMFGHVDELHHRRACEEFNVHQEAWPYRRSDGTKVRDRLHGCLVSRRGIYSARESAKSVRLLDIARILEKHFNMLMTRYGVKV